MELISSNPSKLNYEFYFYSTHFFELWDLYFLNKTLINIEYFSSRIKSRFYIAQYNSTYSIFTFYLYFLQQFQQRFFTLRILKHLNIYPEISHTKIRFCIYPSNLWLLVMKNEAVNSRFSNSITLFYMENLMIFNL